MFRVHASNVSESNAATTASRTERVVKTLSAPKPRPGEVSAALAGPLARLVSGAALGLFAERKERRSKFSSNVESEYSRHRVVSLAPQGMTAGQAFGAEPGAFQHTVSVHCVVGIMGTTGQIPARSWQKRGQTHLIGANTPKDSRLHWDDSPPRLEMLISCTPEPGPRASPATIRLRRNKFHVARLNSR